MRTWWIFVTLSAVAAAVAFLIVTGSDDSLTSQAEAVDIMAPAWVEEVFQVRSSAREPRALADEEAALALARISTLAPPQGESAARLQNTREFLHHAGTLAEHGLARDAFATIVAARTAEARLQMSVHNATAVECRGWYPPADIAATARELLDSTGSDARARAEARYLDAFRASASPDAAPTADNLACQAALDRRAHILRLELLSRSEFADTGDAVAQVDAARFLVHPRPYPESLPLGYENDYNLTVEAARACLRLGHGDCATYGAYRAARFHMLGAAYGESLPEGESLERRVKTWTPQESATLSAEFVRFALVASPSSTQPDPLLTAEALSVADETRVIDACFVRTSAPECDNLLSNWLLAANAGDDDAEP